MLHFLPSLRSSQSLIGLACIAVGFLFSISSCAMSKQTIVAQIQPQSPAVSQPKATTATTDPIKVELSQQTLYQLLVAEFAARRNQLPLAVKNYLEIAYRTRDPEVARRTIEVAFHASDWKRGTEAARLWVSIRPLKIAPHSALASMLLRSGNADETVAELQWIIAALEQQGPPGRGFYEVSKLLANENNTTLAIQIMRQIVAAHTEDAYAQSSLANLLASNKNTWRESILRYQHALKLAPDDGQIVQFYARVLQRYKRIEDALKILDQFLERNQDAFDVRMDYARILIVAEQDEEALQQLQQVYVHTPDSAEVNYTMGLLLMQAKQYDAAEQAFKRLTRTLDKRYVGWYHLAQVYEIQDRVEDALNAYRHVNRGRYRLAAQIKIAILLASQGNLDTARDYLHGIPVRGVKERVKIYRVEARLLSIQERYTEAMQVYDKALKLIPNDNELLMGRAMLADKFDDIDSLERDLLSIIERNPNHADALNSLGYTLADRTTRYDEALDYIQRAYQIKPNSYYIVDSMGWIMYRLERYQEALFFLRKAMVLYAEKEPGQVDQEIAAHIGEVLWALGNKAEAQQVWDTALEHKPDSELIINIKKRLGL